MRREINMYNPASPGACWVMECQECFGAVLITGTLDYPLVNTLVTAKILQPPPEMCVWLCMCICDYFLHNWSKLCVLMSVPAWNASSAFAHLCVNLVWVRLRDLILSVWSWLRCKDHNDPPLLFLLPNTLFLLPHSSSVSLAFTATTEPNADPACEVRALPANHLAGSLLHLHHKVPLPSAC